MSEKPGQNTNKDCDNLPESEYGESIRNHEALCTFTEISFANILQQDELMKDFSSDVTSDEVLAQIAVLKGQSITIYIQRETLPKFKIVIPGSQTTVAHLKKTIQRYYENDLKRETKRKLAKYNQDEPSTRKSGKLLKMLNAEKISWRYVWRTYFLEINDSRTLLRDNNRLLSDYGVRNKCVLKFAKKTKRNNSRR